MQLEPLGGCHQEVAQETVEIGQARDLTDPQGLRSPSAARRAEAAAGMIASG